MRCKFYLHRSASWLSLMNAGLIIFLALSRLQKEYGVEMDLSKYIVPLYIAGVVVLIFLGWVDDKLRFYQHEAKEASQRNPILMEVLERVKAIETKVEKIEKRSRGAL
jgi:UDP-N-acetylmuramyl pentapeptide phosphotransferase/UDP-N-acetylglucosamine-1-phosphate transferase